MTTPTINFLKKLLDTPGPSGFESAPARVWRDEVKGFADDVKADVHGNSVASLNGKGKPRVMLTGHIDEIGFQITHIDYDVKADVHGNSVASLNGKGKPRVMLTGHIDEIGFQITHIDDDGYLYFSGI